MLMLKCFISEGMLDCGLRQAVYAGGRQLSPTLGVASLDTNDGGTGEDFLEVRYTDSKIAGNFISI